MAKRKTAKLNSLNKTASGQSARSHQKDLAKISGTVAGKAAFRKTMKDTEQTWTLGKRKFRGGSLDKAALAGSKAEKKATKKTMGSFKKSK